MKTIISSHKKWQKALETPTWTLWWEYFVKISVSFQNTFVYVTSSILKLLLSSQAITCRNFACEKHTSDRRSSTNTFSSFFSLRYSSFPFFPEDSSRGKRLRCSRAPLPSLRSSSSSSSLLPPSDWRAARDFPLRYSVRAYGEERSLIQLSL